MQHDIYMQRCLTLAALGKTNVAPNPMVGCVIVHDGKIIAEGYHQFYGGPHAEVNAINAVANKELLKESTLYVNLEPCSHYGKTPPCANLILQYNIPRVVVGNTDPNPLVAGSGIRLLQQGGVEVISPVLPEECNMLNKRFITYHSQKRPYIILKWAQSADGFIAPETPEQIWLTNDVSKTLVHKWRSEESAILVGANTVQIDNPQLTTRLWQGKNPVRVVLDKNLRLDVSHNVFDASAKTIVITEHQQTDTNNITYLKADFNESLPHQIASLLFQQGLSSVIIEGGAVTLNTFINANLWDEARVFTAAVQLFKGIKAPVLHVPHINALRIERDNLHVYRNV